MFRIFYSSLFVFLISTIVAFGEVPYQYSGSVSQFLKSYTVIKQQPALINFYLSNYKNMLQKSHLDIQGDDFDLILKVPLMNGAYTGDLKIEGGYAPNDRFKITAQLQINPVFEIDSNLILFIADPNWLKVYPENMMLIAFNKSILLKMYEAKMLKASKAWRDSLRKRFYEALS